MATIQSPPTNSEVEKAPIHFVLYLRHSSIPSSLCTVQFLIDITKVLHYVLYPEFYDHF
jgi:hypothetical protein